MRKRQKKLYRAGFKRGINVRKKYMDALDYKLKASEQALKDFMILELEELREIRNRTGLNGSAMNMCNRRIKTIELMIKEKESE